ncbi:MULTISPECIES: NADP-dependent phosphogluconate dehydrogenase [Actinotignum]|uniref:NADP-dependent phosphogluconate dehydrogenase n=1 Tax=Actinotignum TaxID=1653174 RepID=UPI000412A1F6|nr:NADP-dependent phosphogluconate dehydrogenase [Actinotignum schaalii]AIE83076.1 6-phosphogluconate dehydrogenase [Actinotignum schaalii]WQN45236.1 NADP-dependent phosphogluconate dehydrogenase [Actinotignum schaalii]
MSIPTPPVGVADIGVTGMAVMGSNLARNLASRGYKVAIHNRTAAKTERVMAEHGSEGEFYPSESMADFVAALARPRVAIIMVKAGKPTDAVIEELADLMEPGDIIVDCGNSLFTDTMRREAEISARGLHFVGTGVSGGEEGALKGPSIMPGGTRESYDRLGPMFEAIAARKNGEPCCTYVGPNGAGHFVKMVHNGIEYADMQLIAEAYDLMRTALGMNAAEIGDVFERWNSTELDSYLIEITAEVLRQRDATTGAALVDMIADAAAQKGTGAWTVQNAAAFGVPATGIAEATFARSLSGDAAERAAGRALPGHTTEVTVEDRERFIEDIRLALYASKMVAYSQGFELIRKGSLENSWGIDLGAMARIWRAGCIIRAAFLDRITEAYTRQPDLPLLLADPYFSSEISGAVEAWRRIVVFAAQRGVPIPAFASSLAYYDGVRAERLPANLIQAQRDYFGAHTYRRLDTEGVFHTVWQDPARPEERWD